METEIESFVRRNDRILVFSAIFIAALFLTYEVTKSFELVAVAAIVLFITWVLIANIGEAWRGRELKKFLSMHARKADLDNTDSVIRDFVFFNGKLYTSVVKLMEEGVYIYSFGLFSCIIPWENIASFTMLRGNNDINRKRQIRAKINFVDVDARKDVLSIPWDDSFKEIVPSCLMKREKGS